MPQAIRSSCGSSAISESALAIDECKVMMPRVFHVIHFDQTILFKHRAIVVAVTVLSSWVTGGTRIAWLSHVTGGYSSRDTRLVQVIPSQLLTRHVKIFISTKRIWGFIARLRDSLLERTTHPYRSEVHSNAFANVLREENTYDSCCGLFHGILSPWSPLLAWSA